MTSRVVCAIAVAIGLQTVRDVRQETVGTGQIAGIVTTEDAQPRPLRFASVTLSGDPLLSPRLFVTNSDGRFSFPKLPAGQYTMQVRTSGYMPKNFGAKRPDGPGVSIVLADGQRATDLSIALTRWASISGIVYDQNGEPLENASVEALAYSMRTGIRTLGSVYGKAIATDDRGIYRYAGLAPGDYYLAVGPSESLGAIETLSSSDVDRALQQLSAGTRPAATGATSHSSVTYAPTYFPGTSELASATKITLAAGEDRAGIDMRLQLVPASHISGTVTMPDGSPASNISVNLTLVDVPNSIDLFRSADQSAGRTDASGRFHFSGVAPGRYDIKAQRVARQAVPQSSTGSATPAISSDLLWAKTTVAVNGADVDVALPLQGGLTLSGHLVFDGTTLKPPSDLSAVTIGVAIPGYVQLLGGSFNSAKADGTFLLAAIAAGRMRLTARVPGSTATTGWFPRSAIVNGVDAFDAPVDIAQNTNDIVVTFTDHPTELAGAVQTPPGEAASDYFVIVFSTDRAQWGPQSRRTVMARPTTAGAYRIVNLPPGEYFIAAVTDVMPNEWFDSEFLEQLAPASLRITLAESEHKNQDIRIR